MRIIFNLHNKKLPGNYPVRVVSFSTRRTIAIPAMYAPISLHAKELPMIMLASLECCKPNIFTKWKYWVISTAKEKINTAMAVGITGRSKKDLTKQ